VFATIIAIIVVPTAKSVIAFAGLALVIFLTSKFSFTQMVDFIDWNILAVLLGSWIIVNYMIKSNLANYIAYKLSEKIRSVYVLILMITIVAGLISTFLANVQVVLIFAPIAIAVAKVVGLDILKISMIIALAANYMGTALMLGDLPPLLLHAVGGAEFYDFIWFRGKPSSFFLLLTSFIITTLIFYKIWFRTGGGSHSEGELKVRIEKPEVFKLPAILSVVALAIFMFLAIIRPLLGLPLGVIAMVIGLLMALILEIVRIFDKNIPGFDEILKDVEWEALAFYAVLFGLTGALEVSGFFEEVSRPISQLVLMSPLLAYTFMYWVTTGLATLVEHDALLMVLLYMVRDVANIAGIDAWPYYWGLAWAATLGSNATIAAAPTLYLALVLAEKEEHVRRSWKDWLKITLPFTVVSSAINFILSIPIVF
jgi:Na+/H+ antiporter NhaD/arsenite permease-like protein